jgi:hypothetical protein
LVQSLDLVLAEFFDAKMGPSYGPCPDSHPVATGSAANAGASLAEGKTQL